MRRTWIRSAERSLAVHVYEPDGAQTAGVLVVVPSFGFEAEVSYRSMVAVAERATSAGFLAIVTDPTGHGDSACSRGVEDLVGAWHGDVRAIVGMAARLAPRAPVTLLGHRLGGAVVASFPGPEVARRIAWEPVSGRSFVRRQQLVLAISQPSADPAVRGSEPFALDLTPGQLDNLRTLRAPKVGAASVEVWMDEDRRAAEAALGLPPFYAEIPFAVIDDLVGALPRAQASPLVPWTEHVVSDGLLAPGAEGVTESFVRIGPHRLCGVLTLPPDGPGPTWLVFTGQGAERASGPSGLWTDLARDGAAAGLVGLRADRRRVGWHVDPAAAREPNPFTPEGVEDVVDAVRHARESGARRVVLVGSCAGAWLALAAAGRTTVDDVVALNVPSWSGSARFFDDAFLAHWNGPSPLADSTPGRSARLRAGAIASLTRWPRVRERVMRARETVRAAGRRSVGLPLLWAVGRTTTVHVLLSGRDLAFFAASGGRAVLPALRRAGRDIRLTRADAIDHGLRTARSRHVVREVVERAVGAP
ncbi:serine aminopeptidase domain-containing protein [Agilicoccus flavus]|uniref:serine aminopeptidase domain-containing protein n=1 Tax=Agilicoccus flavus TaxID=2775968 RepID=UPI001CF67BC6|nr:alpha/beta hydrolase [Agilicoccus flavus]